MRTKSALFDDDVVDTFGHLGIRMGINDIIAVWQGGNATAFVTRKALSQSIAAMAAVGKDWTANDTIQTLQYLVKTYPELYQEDPPTP